MFAGGVLGGVALLSGCQIEPDPQTFVVYSDADMPDGVPGDGICATPTGECTLRAAVMEANADPDLELIVLEPSTYELTLAGSGEDAGLTGDLDVRTSLRVRGNGAKIDGVGLDRVLDLHDGAVRLDRVTIMGGSVAGDGGGVRNGATGFSMFESALVGNQASGAGGGLFNLTEAALMNVSVLSNTASFNSGGGLANSSTGHLVVFGATVTGNQAGGSGGALASLGIGTTNSLRVGNSVVAENGTRGDGAPTSCAGSPAAGVVSTVDSLGHNVEDGFSCRFASTGDREVDPEELLLSPIIDEPGRAPFRRPLPGSRMLDAIPFGDRCPVGPDQRGGPRGLGAACDVGAIEAAPAELEPLHLVVDTASDTTDAAPGDRRCADAIGMCSLRAAVQETNAFPGADTMQIGDTVDPQLSIAGSNEDAAATGDLDVTDALAIDGNGSVVSANDLDRVLHVGATTVAVTDLTLRDGAAAAGAGLLNRGGDVRLDRVTVAHNFGTDGGGVRNDTGGTMFVTNSTFSDNHTTGSGAAIFNTSSSQVDLYLSTVTGNSVGAGGALRTTGAFGLQGVAIGEQLVGANCSGALASSGHNVSTDGTCSLTGTNDRSNVAGLDLGPLTDNGGPTPTHLPDPTSLLVDAVETGTGAICDTNIALDQRRIARPQDGDLDGVMACDIGAAELEPMEIVPLVVDVETDTIDVSPGDDRCVDAAGACSLRAAIQEANASPDGNLVAIEPGIDPVLSRAGGDEDASATGDLDIVAPLTIEGAGTTVDAAGLDRVFHVKSRAVFRNLTMTGGDELEGGGLRNEGGDVVLEGVLLSRNSGATGGAVRNDNGGTLTVVNSTISHNTSSGNGGAIYNTASGTVDLRYSTITANSSGTGGALRPATGLIRLQATIVADQLGGSGCDSAVTSGGYNVSDDLSCALGGVADQQSGDAGLMALDHNGGPTHTHRIVASSPAVDRVPLGAACDGLVGDQRGVPRPDDGNDDGVGGCDAGAVELATDETAGITGVRAAVFANDAAHLLVGYPTGGAFSGPGVTGSSFDPAAAGVADSVPHAITYSGIGPDGPFATSTHVLVLSPEIAGPSAMELDAPPVALVAPWGAALSGPGVTAGLPSHVGEFDPSAAGSGPHMVTAAGTFCARWVPCKLTKSITVAGFVDPPSAAPFNGDPIALSAVPAGGTFSGPGVTGGNFDPRAVPLGTHTLTYTFDEAEMSTRIEVFDVRFTVNGHTGAALVNLSFTAASPAGGSFYASRGTSSPSLLPDASYRGRCDDDPLVITYSGSYRGAAYAVQQTLDISCDSSPPPSQPPKG